MKILPTTRRAFLAAMAASVGSIACGRIEPALAGEAEPADVILRIGRVRVEIAPGHTVDTVGYNGSAPAPLVRLREGVPALVDISNETDTTEYVHWHGFPVPSEIDGTEEEGSLAVPPGGHLRYTMVPIEPGSRWVHSHAMAMEDLTKGTYSGQFGFVYVEPKNDRGDFDQELFLVTHEWEPFFIEGDDSAMGGAVEEFGETDWGPSFVEVGYRIRSINGRALGHGEPVRVKEGQRVLFHFLNASATENIELSLPGHEFLVTALDGNRVPHPRLVPVIELGAAERVDAIVEMRSPGVWILGSTDADVRGSGLGILVEYAGKKGVATEEKSSGAGWDYTLFGRNQDVPRPDERVHMVIERLPPDARGLEHWTINGRGYDQAKPRLLRKDSRYRLVFDNRTADAHPLHVHRDTFELRSVNGKRTSGVRKDVVVVKAYQTVEVDLTPRIQGLTLFHCHNQLHMDHGFKALFDVT